MANGAVMTYLNALKLRFILKIYKHSSFNYEKKNNTKMKIHHYPYNAFNVKSNSIPQKSYHNIHQAKKKLKVVF